MTIKRLRHVAEPTGEDEYGNPTFDELDPVELEGAFVAPRKSEGLDQGGRSGVIVGLTLYAPHGTDLVYTDRVEVDDDVYEIDGEPGSWHSPLTGWKAGIEAALVRGEG